LIKIKRQNMCPAKPNLNRKIKMRHVKTRTVLRYKRGLPEAVNRRRTDK
jgi:hypothetical protein